MKQLLILTLLLLIACTVDTQAPADAPQTTEELEQPSATETASDVEEPVNAEVVESEPVNEPEEQVPVEELETPTEEEFEIFQPTLTYEGAYNGPLYATSEQIGSTSMDAYFENLDRNGINFFIGMFAIFGIPEEDSLVSHKNLGYIVAAAQKHPYRIVPFFNPGIGGGEIEEEGYLSKGWYDWYEGSLTGSQKIVGNDFIRGFGEVETQEWSERHNDPKIMKLVQLASDNDINFMFHPVASKMGDVEKMLQAHPDTIFLIHLFREDLEKSESQLIELLQKYDNLYFSMDAAHIIHIKGDAIYDFDSTDKERSIKDFVAYYDSKENVIVRNAIDAYKPLVDAAPDKVMWGTEIGPEYAFDPQVFDRAIKASRLVIAGFDEEDQEAVAYKNALRVFGKGVVVDSTINVIDSDEWRFCTSKEISSCEDTCDDFYGDDDVESPEGETCFTNCEISLSCREEPHMDIG